MARPQKIGLDYFPVDTNISDDDKIFYIESEHGIVGFGVFIKLLTKIYDNSYFIEWNKFRQNVFARKFNVDINIVLDVINVALECGLFNEKLYKNYTILTSSAIQNRYLKAVSRRSNVDLVEEFSLIDVNEYSNITLVGVNVYNNYDSTLINVDIGTQRREQDSKEQERKEEDNKDPSINDSDDKPKEQKNIAIFNSWQSKEVLHQHAYLTEAIKKQLDKIAIKDVDDVIKAIDRYTDILNDDKYFYSHVWTLNVFLKQGNGYPEFLDEGKIWVAYNSKKKKKHKEINGRVGTKYVGLG
jgi:hypothetical protein